MKKIMFNDKYGLTDAVLKGRKTQTRRVINLTDTDKEYLDTAFDWDLRESVIIDRYAKYKVGEVVAVAQKYDDFYNYFVGMPENVKKVSLANAGWRNKMFVKAELMPHHIRITNIRVERLKFIRDEDCLAEGIVYENGRYYVQDNGNNGVWNEFDHARDAYSFLIDKVSGKGTWESNPWVFVYDFELVD